MGFSGHLGTKLAIAASLFIGQAGLIANPAYAGFDWTPPPQQKTQDALPSADTSVSIVQDGPLTPDPDAVLQESAPPVPVENVQSQSLVDVSPVPAEIPTSLVSPAKVNNTDDDVMYARMPAPMMETSQPAEDRPQPQEQPAIQPIVQPVGQSAEPVLEGFGKDISLPLALREIVPAQYAYSFSNEADAATKISWRGGKPWDVVLDEALAPHNLTHSIVNNTVVIHDSRTELSVAPEPVAMMDQPAVEPAMDVSANLSAPEQEKIQMQAVDQARTREQAQTIPVMNPTAQTEWKARPGYTLRNVIESWAASASVEVEWQSPYDYPIHNAFQYKGRFDEALASLLSQYSKETPRPRGRLYPNLPTGPSVLVVN